MSKCDGSSRLAVAVSALTASLCPQYLHNDKKLLHGDIKSSNVVVKGDFEAVKICDVGMSLPLDENMTGRLRGKDPNPRCIYLGGKDRRVVCSSISGRSSVHFPALDVRLVPSTLVQTPKCRDARAESLESFTGLEGSTSQTRYKREADA